MIERLLNRFTLNSLSILTREKLYNIIGKSLGHRVILKRKKSSPYSRPICWNNTVHNKQGFSRFLGVPYNDNIIQFYMLLVNNYCTAKNITLNDNTLPLIFNKCKNKIEYVFITNGYHNRCHLFRNYLRDHFNIIISQAKCRNLSNSINNWLYINKQILSANNFNTVVKEQLIINGHLTNSKAA